MSPPLWGYQAATRLFPKIVEICSPLLAILTCILVCVCVCVLEIVQGIMHTYVNKRSGGQTLADTAYVGVNTTCQKIFIMYVRTCVCETLY